MIWAIAQLSTKETQFFCVMKVIDGGVLPEFPIEVFERALFSSNPKRYQIISNYERCQNVIFEADMHEVYIFTRNW